MNSIPSDEEFARASRYMRERSRNLDRVRERVLERFSATCPLHDFYILAQIDVDFRAYVFFRQEKDVQECERTGVTRELIDFVFQELDRAGRGSRESIDVAFEFDSDENVNAEYGGDYFLRLR